MPRFFICTGFIRLRRRRVRVLFRARARAHQYVGVCMIKIHLIRYGNIFKQLIDLNIPR